MTMQLIKNAARGGMLNRREPPQITLHNAQEGQCNRQSNDQQDQLHGVDILLLEQPVEQEHKAQRQDFLNTLMLFNIFTTSFRLSLSVTVAPPLNGSSVLVSSTAMNIFPISLGFKSIGVVNNLL